MLSISGSIGHTDALCTIDLSFHPGRIYGITGVNGSGKSTLLHTLAGEITMLDGSADLDGVPVSDPRCVGRIIHCAEPDFYPDLSIGEHLKLLERTGGLTYHRTVREWELESMLDTPPSQVSSGQRQRAFLGSQLGLESAVLLLDEPERHLDSGWVARLGTVLQQKSAAGVIVAVATHSTDLLAFCTDIVELEP